MEVREHRWLLLMIAAAALIVGGLWFVAQRAASFAEEWARVLAPRSTVSREPEQVVRAQTAAPLRTDPSPVPMGTPVAHVAEQSTQKPAPGSLLALLAAQRTASAATLASSSRLCSNGLRLLGSIVNAARPDGSIAAVRVRGGTQLVSIGERVDSFTLLALHPTKAYLQAQDGAVCVLPVLPSGAQAPAVPKSAPPPKPRSAKKPLFEAAELSAGIRSLGPNRFAVSAPLLEKALGNVGALRRSARFRITTQNGRVNGLELATIRAGSPLSHLGLQKGDVVRSLNGHNLAEPDGALQAFARVKEQTEFSLAILRNGMPQTLTYVKE